MHKHGEAILGKEGWNRLHSVISSWANAPANSAERMVHSEAARRVNASGAHLSTQELFPYAVQVALEYGIRPNMAAEQGSVARWLASVRNALRVVWAKATGQPESFKTQDLVNLAFGIAQRENPAYAKSMAYVDAAVAGQDELKFSNAGESDIQKARVLQGDPVAVLDLKDAPSGGYADLERWVTDLFARQGGKALSHEIGEVIIDQRSAKTSLAHSGANAPKKIAFAAVKDVVERGTLVYRATHGNVDSFYFSAPVQISGKSNVVTVLVRRDQNVQRMYLHSVSLKENLLNLRVSSVDAEASERSGSTNSGDASNIANEAKQGKANSAEVARKLQQLLLMDTQASPDILFSRAAPPLEATPTWSAPAITGFDTFIHKIQDKHIDTKRIQDAIEEFSGKLETPRQTKNQPSPAHKKLFSRHPLQKCLMLQFESLSAPSRCRSFE